MISVRRHERTRAQISLHERIYQRAGAREEGGAKRDYEEKGGGKGGREKREGRPEQRGRNAHEKGESGKVVEAGRGGEGNEHSLKSNSAPRSLSLV